MPYQAPNPLLGSSPLGAVHALPPPQVEVITQHAGETAAAPPPWHRAWRMRVFLIVLFATLVPGLIWDFTRPAQYRAAASLLTEVPTPGSVDTGPAQADIQHVTIQQRMLLGRELLAETLRLAGGPAAVGINSPEGLESVLAVTPMPDTNLVEISATGGEPERLAVVVNAWTDAYQNLRQQELEKDVGAQQRALNDEQAALDDRIAERRRSLEDFRARHDIVTLERDGNEALARLKALTTDLNRARDEGVEAEARLKAIEDAVTRGEPVVPPADQPHLDALEEKATALRAKLAALKKRFTPLYLENEPDIKLIPLQLEELESLVAAKRKEGRDAMLGKARQDVQQTRQRVQVMEADLVRQKEEAARFTTAFAEYEAMQTDLKNLEALSQENHARLTELEAKGLERYPPVRVIEPASPPAYPFQPLYWRDAGFVLLAALSAALCAVLLLEFLTRRPGDQGIPAPITGIRVFAGTPFNTTHLPAQAPYSRSLQQADPTPALSADAQASLPVSLPRELIPAEVEAIWALADPMSRELMTLLLSGLTLEECAALEIEDFDLDAGTLLVPSEPPRAIHLAPSAAQLFAACRPLPLWAGGGGHLSADELSMRIALLSHDAGLSQASEVDATALRHTYIAYLVRQGARLTELERILGPMPPSALARYRTLAPAGPARSLDQVAVTYPILERAVG